MVFPLYWMIATAFKPGRDILSLTPKWVPSPFTLQNFQDAIGRPYFFDDIKNSLLVVGGTVIISLALAFLAGRGRRFGFKGRTAFIILIIGVRWSP
jgi:N,N'-diacetylchitobiose transport system permease protein